MIDLIDEPVDRCPWCSVRFAVPLHIPIRYVRPQSEFGYVGGTWVLVDPRDAHWRCSACLSGIADALTWSFVGEKATLHRMLGELVGTLVRIANRLDPNPSTPIVVNVDTVAKGDTSENDAAYRDGGVVIPPHGSVTIRPAGASTE